MAPWQLDICITFIILGHRFHVAAFSLHTWVTSCMLVCGHGAGPALTALSMRCVVRRHGAIPWRLPAPLCSTPHGDSVLSGRGVRPSCLSLGVRRRDPTLFLQPSLDPALEGVTSLSCSAVHKGALCGSASQDAGVRNAGGSGAAGVSSPNENHLAGCLGCVEADGRGGEGSI